MEKLINDSESDKEIKDLAISELNELEKINEINEKKIKKFFIESVLYVPVIDQNRKLLDVIDVNEWLSKKILI